MTKEELATFIWEHLPKCDTDSQLSYVDEKSGCIDGYFDITALSKAILERLGEAS